MPTMNGYEFLTTIMSDSRYSAIPVIVTTAKDSEEDEIWCLENGAADFVSKPYQPEVVKRRVDRIIRLRETAAILNVVEKDHLTGLYSKESFYLEVERILEKNLDRQYDMVVADMENFKAVNECLGIKIGDQILCYMAKRYKEEIIGVTLGNDLENIIPQEMSLLDDEDLELLFDLKFVENRLFCFEKQGFVSYQEEGQKEIEKEVEKERKKEGQKGPIIICVDTSGSMYGAPETVAKAITLMLTAKARKEKRNCYLINFSTGTVCTDMSGAVGVNKINDFLELSFGGGTDVGAGLEVGVEQMEKENYKNSDLLVISDGDFGYISNSLEQKMRQKRKEKNKFYLLDVNGNSGAKRFFDKHWVYDSNSKNVRVLCEMKEEMEKKNV